MSTSADGPAIAQYYQLAVMVARLSQPRIALRSLRIGFSFGPNEPQ
jgi:hypothetical protein